MIEPAEGMVLVSAERLRALEALEAKQRDTLLKLREKDKENPQEHSKRVLKHYHKNKDAINEKRREAYRLKKEAEAAAKSGQPMA